MHKINSSTELKLAIQLLEIEQAEKRQLLKEQLDKTYDSLKLINLLKGAMEDISSSPYLIDNILGTGVGVASGYLSKKIVVGGSSSLIRNFIGSILQFGVTNVVAKHPEVIRTIGQFIIQYFKTRKEKNSKSYDE